MQAKQFRKESDARPSTTPTRAPWTVGLAAILFTTVATLVRILSEKGFLEQTNEDRPFKFRPLRTFDDVSGNLVSDLISRVFGGSREKLLIRLMEQERLTPKERQALEQILAKKSSETRGSKHE